MALMKKNWWKITAVILVLYTIIGGFLMEVPRLPILHESIRNQYFHVSMWFCMIIILSIAITYSIRYLSNNKIEDDIIASEASNIGLLLGILGITTGALWAKNTWGAYWVGDPIQNGAAITLLIYLAYVVLRNSMDEEQKRARVSAVYSIFAYVMLIVFLFIYPRMSDSLHPGKGGNPGFAVYDLDNNMRKVFYPAVLGWTLLFLWIMNLRIRLKKLKRKAYNV